jgi:hypothetical protein
MNLGQIKFYIEIASASVTGTLALLHIVGCFYGTTTPSDGALLAVFAWGIWNHNEAMDYVFRKWGWKK